MRARFFAPTLSRTATTVDLDGEESHHLLHVLRLGVGAEVLAFDGQGLQVLARVERTTRHGATLAVVGPAPAAPERRVNVTLGLAVLKGDRMDSAIRDATMMGATAIVPIVTDRTVVPRHTASSERQHVRWLRLAVSGAKQCGRAVVPAVGKATALGGFLQASLPSTRVILTEPALGAQPAADLTRHAEGALQGGAVVLCGPEGGWTVSEVAEAAQAGFDAWSLGPMTLRADAVPVAALAVLYYAWEPAAGASR